MVFFPYKSLYFELLMFADANISSLGYLCNLVPRALFPGFGGGAAKKAGEKRPGDEVATCDASNVFRKSATADKPHFAFNQFF